MKTTFGEYFGLPKEGEEMTGNAWAGKEELSKVFFEGSQFRCNTKPFKSRKFV